MKMFPIVVAMLALGACSSNDAPPEAGPKAPAAAAGPAMVTLDEAAQRSGGIRVEPAVERALPETLRANARLTNDEDLTWRVGAITEGRVVRVLAAVGDTVKKGQPLARLHSHDVHDSRALYRTARAELQRAKSNLAYALKARDRARRLLALKAASQEQVEHAETELKNAEASLAAANSQVERHRAHLEEFLGVSAEDAGHEHQPGMESDDRDLIPVRSPASGAVVARNVTPGSVVTAANDLFVVSDLRALWALAEVPEEHLSKLRPGMPVRLYVQAWGDQAFRGKIGKLSASLDPVTRTVKVRVVLPNPAGRLKPEMYATAEIDIGPQRRAVFVPSEATQEVRGQNVVFVRTAEDRFEVRPVETGRSVNGALEIVRGLRSGEAVATRGTFILKSEYLKATMAGE